MSKPNWHRRLSRPVAYSKPQAGCLRTLDDARTYLLAIEGGRASRNQWQQAGRLILAAADGGDLEAATRQLELALLMEGALDVKGKER